MFFVFVIMEMKEIVIVLIKIYFFQGFSNSMFLNSVIKTNHKAGQSLHPNEYDSIVHVLAAYSCFVICYGIRYTQMLTIINNFFRIFLFDQCLLKKE